MKIATKILAGAAILGMAFSGAAIGGGAADASTVPVVYAANANGWHASVKPTVIYFGQGGAPFLAQLHWSSWNGTSAWATGKLIHQLVEFFAHRAHRHILRPQTSVLRFAASSVALCHATDHAELGPARAALRISTAAMQVTCRPGGAVVTAVSVSRFG